MRKSRRRSKRRKGRRSRSRRRRKSRSKGRRSRSKRKSSKVALIALGAFGGSAVIASTILGILSARKKKRKRQALNNTVDHSYAVAARDGRDCKKNDDCKRMRDGRTTCIRSVCRKPGTKVRRLPRRPEESGQLPMNPLLLEELDNVLQRFYNLPPGLRRRLRMSYKDKVMASRREEDEMITYSV